LVTVGADGTAVRDTIGSIQALTALISTMAVGAAGTMRAVKRRRSCLFDRPGGFVKFASFVAALVAGAVLTGAAQAAAAAEVIRLTSVKVSEHQPNDTTFIIHNNDLINGKKSGHDTVTCRIVAQNKVSCSIAIVLAAGNLKGKFVQSLTAPGGKGAITGGTGKYAGAKGTFTFRPLNGVGRTRVVVTLK
jgi:hypothetical protein